MKRRMKMLEGIIRESIGKKEAKKLRQDGYLLANIYGKGVENINAAFKSNDFLRAVKNKETLAFDVKLNDSVYKVVVQDYQKDPVTYDLLHVDLIVAQEGVVTTYHIPVKPIGTPKGLKNKGVLSIAKRRIKVRGAIENIPNSFDLDVKDLDVGDFILIRDMNLPEGVECRVADRVAVLGVIKAK